MSAEVVGTIVNDSEISSEIDLISGLNISASAKRKIKEDVGEYLKEQILLSVGDSTSPITGNRFKSLSPSYKKFKTASNMPGEANLEFTGNMLDALDFKPTTDGIKIGVFGSEAGKADGHNNFSGDSTLPLRQFLPKDGQAFVGKIMNEVQRIIADAAVEAVEIPVAEINAVETKSELKELLEEMFPDFSWADIKDAVKRNEELLLLLEENNLLQFVR